VLQDFHYSDDWADPGHQWVPRAWANMPHEEFQKAVFAYTRDTIAAFRRQHVMPDMVQVGNEVVAELRGSTAGRDSWRRQRGAYGWIVRTVWCRGTGMHCWPSETNT
jgi:arabinogalactan endo-1,4-beta-galactosidase